MKNLLMGAIFGTKPTINITLQELCDRRKFSYYSKTGEKILLPCFRNKDTLTGKVEINLNKSNPLEHLGIKIELIGEIHMLVDRGSTSQFICLSRDLENPGELTQEISYFPFSFENSEMLYDSYFGKSMEVRYKLRCSIVTKIKTFSSEFEFGAENIVDEPLESDNDGLQLDVALLY